MSEVNATSIPDELRQRPQWVPWQYDPKFRATKPGQKPRKLPRIWNGRGNAASDNPSTWTTFTNAIASYETRGYTGVAYQLAVDDPYTMFDLDDCFGPDGKLTAEAQEVVDRFNTYTEISVSGKGVKGIVRGKFKGKGKNVPNAGEIYCWGRMFCTTGKHLAGTPTTIRDNQAAVDWFYSKLCGPKKTAEVVADQRNDLDQDRLAERCWKYIQKCPDAISGDGGHAKTFRAACECYRFGLDDAHAAGVMQRYNADKTGDERWSDDDLQHKLNDARKEVEGAGEFGMRLKKKDDVLDRKDPLSIARKFIGDNYFHPENPTIVFVDGEMHRFADTHWEIMEPAALRQQLYTYLEPCKTMVSRGEHQVIEPFKPSSKVVDSVFDAIKGVVYTSLRSPAWMDNAWAMPDPAQLIVAKNGIFQLGDAGITKISDPTPRLFNTSALDYDLLQDPTPPLTWLSFLEDIFENDQDQIQLLQEWFGYVLTNDTSQQKMLLLIGPKRSGKGTIIRVASRLVGLANFVAPTMAGLGTNFGLWPLVGKTLAGISDARLSGRSDLAIVTERLLSISGEDSLTIDRKNRDLITTKLTTRIMVASNELPRLADASGALASRFLILTMRKSFFGSEDTGLTTTLLAEIQGIAAWAIQGLLRLRTEGRFTQPAIGDQLREEMNDLSSPITAFLRDWCIVKSGLSVPTKDLFEAWVCWCVEQGRRDGGTVQTFGRDLRAALSGITMGRPREDGDRVRVYEGIDLTLAAKSSLSISRAKQTLPAQRHMMQPEAAFAL